MGAGIDEVIQAICRVGNVAALEPDRDFYEAGVSSTAALSLLLELESEHGISIPDDQFIAARTARQLHDVVVSLRGEQG